MFIVQAEVDLRRLHNFQVSVLHRTFRPTGFCMEFNIARPYLEFKVVTPHVMLTAECRKGLLLHDSQLCVPARILSFRHFAAHS